MDSDLEAVAAAIDGLDRDTIATAVQEIGFECTDCGACCRGTDGDPHTATVFPAEARDLVDADASWSAVVRPVPFGLDADGRGTTLEWALQTDGCGDCRFLDQAGETTACTRYDDRPSICRTYPFTLAASLEAPPQGEPVDAAGPVVAHECEGLGRAIDRERALALADELLDRAHRSLQEAAGVRATLAEGDPPGDEPTVVADSEGYKRPDGTALTGRKSQR